VQIQDKRLGLLHYFFMLLILGYIVGFTVLWQMVSTPFSFLARGRSAALACAHLFLCASASPPLSRLNSGT
jgi:hypothetical protein